MPSYQHHHRPRQLLASDPFLGEEIRESRKEKREKRIPQKGRNTNKRRSEMVVNEMSCYWRETG